MITMPTPITVQGHTGISSRAMLVDLTIKSWSPVKPDARIVSASMAANGHTRDVASGRKRLTSSALILAVETAKREAYAESRRRTLPWLDTGARILSVDGYGDYQRVMQEKRRDFEDARDAVYSSWYAIIDEARWGGLGGLFDASQYPDLTKLES